MSAEEVAEKFPQFNQIREAFYKQKAKVFPKLPTSIDEIQINGTWALNETGNYLLKIN